jgi:hypothetical protein
LRTSSSSKLLHQVGTKGGGSIHNALLVNIKHFQHGQEKGYDMEYPLRNS